MPLNSRKKLCKNYNYKRRFLPEYGRHIHENGRLPMQIEDRRERNRQARAVIAVMGNLESLLRIRPTSLITCSLRPTFNWDVDTCSLRARNLHVPGVARHSIEYKKICRTDPASMRRIPRCLRTDNLARYMRTKSYEYNQPRGYRHMPIRSKSEVAYPEGL